MIVGDNTSLKAGLVQLNVSDDPEKNLPITIDLIREAAGQGATYIQTPESTNLLSPDRAWKDEVLRVEAEDPTLAALRHEAARLGIWLHIGSLSLKDENPGETRLANRGFMIAPDGTVVARYDKIHMFDVTISDTESYRESAAFRPGAAAVVAPGPVPIGMGICYDLRFGYLFRALAKAGAKILTMPAAFNDTTGAAHWEVLLRARAIETGSFVLAAAQCGAHECFHSHCDPLRRTWGHSLAVAPWGEILADGGTEPGATVLTLDLHAIDKARSRVPSLSHDREFTGP